MSKNKIERELNETLQNMNQERIIDVLSQLMVEGVDEIYIEGKPDEGNKKIEIGVNFIKNHFLEKPIPLMLSYLNFLDHLINNCQIRIRSWLMSMLMCLHQPVLLFLLVNFFCLKR